jgi:CDP-diacylglycerol--glycerol-3-phosphate 3-phosphatidyltransferase
MLKHIPNILSVARFPLSALLLFLTSYTIHFIFVFIVIGVTDVLDGFLARKYGWGTPLGAKIDGFADAFFAICTLVALVSLQIYQQFTWYVIAMIGFVALLKLFNLLVTKMKFGIWSSIHTIASKVTQVPFFFIVIFIVITGQIALWLNAVLFIMLGLVLFADLEETIIIVFSTQFDPDAKSMFLMPEENARIAIVKQIKKYINVHFGYMPKTSWIMHMKHHYKLGVKAVANNFCPPEKQDDLREAFLHFNLISTKA